MKNYLIGGAVVLALVLAFFGGRVSAPSPKLGSYYSSIGAITQTDPTLTNVLLGTTIFGNTNFGANGYTTSTATSTSISAAAFCATTGILIQTSTTAAITLTLPSAASAYTACGSPAAGAWSDQKIVNDSAFTVTITPGSGMSQRQTVGASSTLTMAGTSTMDVWGIWDSASSLIINQSNYR